MSKTIVMIHGMWGGKWCWDNYRDFFEENGYKCIIPILRHHECNPKDVPISHLGTTSLLDYAEDIEKEIQQLDVKPILMGHSMGGLLAQILGSRGLSEAIVLLTPASPYGIIAIKWSVIKSFLSILTKWNFWKKPYRQTFNEAVYSMMNNLETKEQKKAFSKFVYESGQAIFEIGLWFFDSKCAAKVDESKITCPVLVISGTEDKITPASVVKKVAEKYKTATYKEFSNHTHWVIGEYGWKEIAKFTASWLKENTNNT